ncbi:MAG: molybdopterin-synthase adenylyltransferase MoeB [Pedobacter sp.]|nr:MAG: molybdopterin-synthase adenylyltransferase MoeB [Pedobacter sp.]
MLTREEKNRYHRQIILPEIGIEGQQKLKQAKVLMVGAGGLGCPVLQYLVAAGIGYIGIIDDDVISESNLHRQILYSHYDIGQNKAITAENKLKVLNPFVNIEAYTERLEASNVHRLFEKYDLIIDGSDNFPTRYLVNDSCVALNKPLVFGSIYKFEGQVSVFNYNNGPNYRELFPTPPTDGKVPNCSEIGVIGILPGMVGTIMANEAIKIICEIGVTLSGRLLCIDALSANITSFTFGKALDTQTMPNTPSIIAPSNPPAEITANELKAWQESFTNDFCLIDVREEYEYEDENIGGINIPLFELTDRLAEIPAHVTKLVFYCNSGLRSKQATFLIRKLTECELFVLR